MTENQNPEQKARDNIDALLKQAGWAVQSEKKIDLNLGMGQALAQGSSLRQRLQQIPQFKPPRGSKTELILEAINRFAGEFTVSQLEQACPGVGQDMVRRVLREQQNANLIECQGRGPAARWKKKR